MIGERESAPGTDWMRGRSLSGAVVRAHGGHQAWNGHRKKWDFREERVGQGIPGRAFCMSVTL